MDNRSLPAKTQPVAGDSHVASLLEMTNLGTLHVHRECLHICNCQWRSVSAATPHTLAFAILTAAGTGCECSAGSGMPLPYNSRCGRRSTTKPTVCMALSERRYTPYFGVCHFNGGRYGTAVPSRDCTPRALPRAARSGRHVGLRPPRNDNSGAGAVLAAAGTGCECSAGSGMPLPYNAYTKTPNGRGLRPGHGFYTRREEGWKTCGGILLTFRASA